MKKFTFLIFITVLFLFTQCKKDTLPDVTTSGQGSFGCRVDGQLWTPKKSPGSTGILNTDTPFSIRYGTVTHSLSISAAHYYSENDYEQFSIGFLIDPLNPEGIYQSSGEYTAFFGGDCWNNSIDTSKHQQIEILKFDDKEKIVSGTFEFTLISRKDNCFDTTIVTDGRFDAYYKF